MLVTRPILTLFGILPPRYASVLGDGGAEGPITDGDPWAKRVGINAHAVDILSLENIMDVVQQGIFPETEEEKREKERARKKERAEEAEEEDSAAKKAAKDEAMVASQLEGADITDQSLEGNEGNWFTRALCCGPVCGGNNSYDGTTTMVSFGVVLLCVRAFGGLFLVP